MSSLTHSTRRGVTWLALGAVLCTLAACTSLPGTQTLQIDGRSVAFTRQGSGAPTVVFEAGLGDGMAAWSPVFSQVAGFAGVFAYDRPGYGASAKTATPRDGAHLVDELRVLLQRAGVAPPYVLVGHSLGGSFAELFARRYPAEVAGLVLVDSRHHDFARRCQAAAALVCEPPAVLVLAMPGNAPAEYREVGETMRELANAPPLAPMPLAVLTGMRKPVEGPTFRAAWLATQKELAAQSPRAEHVVCEECGHYVQRDRPDLVVAAIRRVVDAARTAR